jgi:alkyl hydroperoxide reductase subunit AhpC
MGFSIGSRIIPFRLKNIDGKMITADEIAKEKKATVIIFSCNHCPYVQAWEDRMVNLGRTYGPKEAGFALINANDPTKYPEDSYPEMIKRAENKKYPFPYLHDEDQSVARAYGATRTPEVFLFDHQGILRYHGRIDDNYEDPTRARSHELKDALEAVLADKSPSVSETPLVGCTVKWK